MTITQPGDVTLIAPLAVQGDANYAVRAESVLGGFAALSGSGPPTTTNFPLVMRREGTLAFTPTDTKFWQLLGGTADVNWTERSLGLGPDFGALDIKTTGSLWLGPIPAATGYLRLSKGLGIASRDQSNTVDLAVYSSTTTTINVQTFGDSANSTTVIASGSSGGAGVNFKSGSTTTFAVSLALAVLNVPLLEFSATLGSAPFIKSRVEEPPRI